MEARDISNITIKNEDYSVNGNKVTCTLVCKVNLKEFENQTSYFTTRFIRHNVSKYLPIIKTVFNDTGKVIAKYYITPDRKARVLEFDNEYYKQSRTHGTNVTVNRGDITNVKKTINPNYHNHESVMYDYVTTFDVQGVASCHPDDTFNLESGKMLALAKAMRHSRKRVSMLLGEISKNAMKTSDFVFEILDDFSNQAKTVNALTSGIVK